MRLSSEDTLTPLNYCVSSCAIFWVGVHWRAAYQYRHRRTGTSFPVLSVVVARSKSVRLLTKTNESITLFQCDTILYLQQRRRDTEAVSILDSYMAKRFVGK